MQITAGQVKAIFPQYKYPADLADALTTEFAKYEIAGLLDPATGLRYD